MATINIQETTSKFEPKQKKQKALFHNVEFTKYQIPNLIKTADDALKALELINNLRTPGNLDEIKLMLIIQLIMYQLQQYELTGNKSLEYSTINPEEIESPKGVLNYPFDVKELNMAIEQCKNFKNAVNEKYIESEITFHLKDIYNINVSSDQLILVARKNLIFKNPTFKMLYNDIITNLVCPSIIDCIQKPKRITLRCDLSKPNEFEAKYVSCNIINEYNVLDTEIKTGVKQAIEVPFPFMTQKEFETLQGVITKNQLVIYYKEHSNIRLSYINNEDLAIELENFEKLTIEEIIKCFNYIVDSKKIECIINNEEEFPDIEEEVGEEDFSDTQIYEDFDESLFEDDTDVIENEYDTEVLNLVYE
ncbi:hypothetical protein MrNuV_ORF037 [Macrobrachium rosenbergii nudivirus]|nr:hypothetical protein MrNuV_ORF037 [Macrobrachium rosenbergii nudivirus]